MDEHPPRYFLDRYTSPEMLNSGKKGGQLVRYLPAKENQRAGQVFKSLCFKLYIEGWTPAEFKKSGTPCPPRTKLQS